MVEEVNKERPFYKRPIFMFLVMGLIIRFVCAPLLTYDYDMYHWGVIMQNIDSGNELYQMTGYFYTPVWGYIMGFMDVIWNNLASIDVFGIFSTEMIPIEELAHNWHMATITSPAFNVAMKIPLILCDILVGYLIYKIVFEWTNDKKKSEFAFGIWFLCPIVLYMSGIQGMFDTFAALMILLCIMLLIKEHYLLAGVLFSCSVLLKMFPAATVILLILFVLMKYDFKKEGVRNLGIATVGAVIGALVIMLPNIMEGNIENALTFITDRSDRTGFITYIQIFAVVVLELYIAYRFSKLSKFNLDRELVKYSLFAMIAMFILGVNPQYMIIIMPFLIIQIVTSDRRYAVGWWLIAIGAMMSALIQNNVGLLASIAVFQNFVPIDWILSVMQTFESSFIGDITYMTFVNFIFMIVEFVGLAVVFIFLLEEPLTKRFSVARKYFEKLEKMSKKEVSEDA